MSKDFEQAKAWSFVVGKLHDLILAGDLSPLVMVKKFGKDFTKAELLQIIEAGFDSVTNELKLRNLTNSD